MEKADCDKVQPGLTPIAENHEVACHADDQKVLSDLAAISTQAHMQQLDEKDFYPDGIPRRGQADG